MTTKITKIGCGSYEAKSNGRTVTIDRIPDGEPNARTWIAAAEWDRDLVSDPLPTFKAAKNSAFYMLGSNL